MTMVRQRIWVVVLSLAAVAVVTLPSAAGAAPGDLDPSFGVGGKVVSDLGGQEAGHALLPQPNGKFLVGGYANVTSADGGDFLLARYTAGGVLDPVFGGDGSITTDFGRSESVRGVAFRPGQVIAVGTTSVCCVPSEIALARYRLDGSLDPTFDGDGLRAVEFEGLDARGYDVVFQPDGKIVVAGAMYHLGEPFVADFAVSRYNVDGSLDSSFGTGGLVTTDFGTGEDQAFALVMQPDGRIVVAGWARSSDSESDFAVARYDADGELDESFGEDGKVTVDFGGLDTGLDLELQADGKIVVVGSTTASTVSNDFAIVRLNTDGTLDTEGLDPYMDAPFGVGGKVITDFAADDDIATSVAIEPGGKVLVAGLATPQPGVEPGDFGLARYNVDGSLDPSFGSGGKVTTSFTEGQGMAWGVAVQRDERIVLAGLTQGSFDIALARYLVRGCCFSDGSPSGTEPVGPLP